MKVLVTGGAGYLGSILVPYLLNKGHQVRVLDNLIYKQTSLLPYFINPNFEFTEGDVRNKDNVKRSLENVDFIVNLVCWPNFIP